MLLAAHNQVVILPCTKHHLSAFQILEHTSAVPLVAPQFTPVYVPGRVLNLPELPKLRHVLELLLSYFFLLLDVLKKCLRASTHRGLILEARG